MCNCTTSVSNTVDLSSPPYLVVFAGISVVVIAGVVVVYRLPAC